MDADSKAFAALPPLSVGEPAPWFVTPAPGTERYGFHSVAGRYILMAFLPEAAEPRARAVAALQANRAPFDDINMAAFLVVRDPETMAVASNALPGLRWLFDPTGDISRSYHALDSAGREDPHWLLLDPTLRVLARAPIESGAIFDEIARLPPVEVHAGTEVPAPVLIVPRILERELCRRLIDLYDADGGSPSGVMRDIQGRTVGVLDDFKKRRDAQITDQELRRTLMSRIRRRLVPEILKVYQFPVTRLERYIVACYDAQDGGYFKPHRDNLTLATGHRRFAVSINLNAEEFEGGDLRFPEFGRQTYRPPTGGAVVFSCALLHEATPVTRGRRYAFLPFLYDEAGAEMRRDSQSFLSEEVIGAEP